MDEQKLLYLIEKAVHIGERYGVASLQKDTATMNRLSDDYAILREEARKLLQPLWGVSSQMAWKSQMTAQQAQAQMQSPYPYLQQQYAPPLTMKTIQDAYDRMKGIIDTEPEPDIVIEFSL